MKNKHSFEKTPDMQVVFQRPGIAQLSAFNARISGLSLSYSQQGATQRIFPSGYDHDHYRFKIGQGAADFDAARRCVQQLGMFPGWAMAYLPSEKIDVGKEVTVVFRLLGLYWYNACRILYLVDETDRFGFAYGTLAAHVECGEERFLVTRDLNGAVSYHIDAFSRPAHWLVRLGYPVARRFQKRFARDSAATIQAYLQKDHDAR